MSTDESTTFWRRFLGQPFSYWLTFLRAGEVCERRLAARALRRIAANALDCIQALHNAMHDRDLFVREEAAAALKSLAETKAAPLARPTADDLMERLDRAERQHRQSWFDDLAVFDDLADLGPEARIAVPKLMQIILNGGYPKYYDGLAMEAQVTLASIAPDAVGPLIEARGQKEEWDVWAVIFAMDLAALPSLIVALAHDDPKVRRQATGLVDGLGPAARSAFPALLRNLADVSIEDETDREGAESAASVAEMTTKSETDAVCLFGDCGGTLYVAAPDTYAAYCQPVVLKQLLLDLDRIYWNNHPAADVRFSGTASDIWINDEFKRLGLESAIREVLCGTRGRLIRPVPR